MNAVGVVDSSGDGVEGSVGEDAGEVMVVGGVEDVSGLQVVVGV